MWWSCRRSNGKCNSKIKNMANQELGAVTTVASLLKSDSLIVEVGGSIRRITVEEFLAAVNSGQTQLLHSVAWGIPIKDELQSSPAWGMVGNTAAYNAYKAQVGRYLMDANGRAAKLHPNNSGVFADGTTLDETKGNVVVIAPKLYYLYQVDAETNIPYLWMSQQPISKRFIGTAERRLSLVLTKAPSSPASLCHAQALTFSPVGITSTHTGMPRRHSARTGASLTMTSCAG